MCENGFFGDLFDVNGNGKLDTWEQVADSVSYMEMTEQLDGRTEPSDHSTYDGYDDGDE